MSLVPDYRALLLLLALGSTAAADEAQQQVDEVRARVVPLVERVLGDPFPNPVPVFVLERDAFVKRAGVMPTHARAEARRALWVRLGLISGDPVVRANAEKELAGPAGFHDRREKCNYVAAECPAVARQHVVSHELIHAHRDAMGLYDKWPENWSDAEIAFRCAAEGDAQFWAAAVLGSEAHGAKKEALDAAARSALSSAWVWALPSPSRESYALVALQEATYGQGWRFAARVHAHGGREALDAALREPPTSTEQILHPEKYLGRVKDEPVRFGEADVVSVLGAEWTQVATDDLGELLLRIFFGRALGAERGPGVAEGWDGCRFQLFSREGRVPLLVLMTAWDSDHDAAVFAGAWCDWAGRRDGKPYAVHTKPGVAGAMRTVHTKAGLVTTVRRGTEVMVVDGVVGENQVDILRALWRASRKP